jgi:cation:H+ antiporter
MYDPTWPFATHAAVFIVTAVLVAVVGVRLTDYAARIARRTGLGQALTGALFLGASTSLSGITTSVSAAAAGHAELAASNAVGGIAAQTVFLAIADRVYRRANLEHAAASDENMLQGALLVTLLSLALLAALSPPVAVLGVHPISIVILLAYGFGQRLVMTAEGQGMWQPRVTEYTQIEERRAAEGGAEHTDERPAPSSGRRPSMAGIWVRFAATALAIGIFGYALAQSGVVLAERTGLSETAVGGLFTAIATSFPELVTAVAAVRIGALTLAVSDIMGGNAFDVIFLAVADTAYRGGSLYHAMGDRPTFLMLLTILLTSILLMGLIRREKHGIANIGFESFLLFLVYAGGFLLMTTFV